MPNITVTGGSACSGSNHRTISTDAGSLVVLDGEFAAISTGGFDDIRDAFLTVIKHQYKTRRFAGRTHAQALSDLVGFTVRL